MVEQDLILIVDSDEHFLRVVNEYLRAQRCHTMTAGSIAQALDVIKKNDFSLVIAALQLRDGEGLTVVQCAKERDLLCEVVLTTEAAGLNQAIASLQEGSFGLMLKPIPNLTLLGSIVARALERRQVNIERESLINDLHHHERELQDEIAKAIQQVEHDRNFLANALKLSRAVNRTLEHNEIIQSIQAYFEVLPGSWQYCLCEYVPDRAGFRVLLHNRPDWPTDAEVFINQTDEPLMFSVMHNNSQAVLEAAGYADETLTRSALKPVSICQPVQAAGACLGLLNIHVPNTDRFPEEDKRLVELSSEIVGMALQNSILFEKTREMSRRDGLTGLFNHSYLMELLSREVLRAHRYYHPLALIMCDMDRFKVCNDTLGHQGGDELLIAVADSIRSTIREDLDIAARYGGDEFAIILPNTNLAGAQAIADRLHSSVQEACREFQEKNHTFIDHLGLSMGLAEFELGMQAGDLITIADKALYEHKNTDR